MPTSDGDPLARAYATSCEAPRPTDEFLELLYDELRSLARARLRALPPGNTLQPTALVHEVWVKLGGGQGGAWNSHRHFFVAASEAMRQVIVDAARAKGRVKRGGGRVRVELRDDELAFDGSVDEVLAVDEVLRAIDAEAPRTGEVLRLRYLGGLSVEETAAALDVSPRTVKREWRTARAMVLALLAPGTGGDSVLGEGPEDA